MIEIRILDASAAARERDALAAILVDCVAGGASVNFMAGFSPKESEAFFGRVVDAVAAGDRLLLGAFWDSKLLGTVQVMLSMPPNQPHRAELTKMLVHREARKKGLGRALLDAVDVEAKACGKSLITLDTVTGSDAERLYQRCGYQRAGIIPDYALWPDGRPCATTFLWKAL